MAPVHVLLHESIHHNLHCRRACVVKPALDADFFAVSPLSFLNLSFLHKKKPENQPKTPQQTKTQTLNNPLSTMNLIDSSINSEPYGHVEDVGTN